MRRGRPPYPNVLTPREQEVLALIREGLTNDQIATRLGISESGARYHVSEILSKLGVGSRHEAAQWAGGEERRWPSWLAVPQFSPMFLAGSVVATAAVALVGLAVGVLIMDARGEEQPKESVSFTSVPLVVSPTPALSQEAAQLASQIMYEARQAYRFARHGLADPALCQCDPVEFVLNLRPGTTWCKATTPDLRLSPYFIPSLHEDWLGATIEACRLLDATSASTLNADARQVVALLEPLLIADDAQRQAQSTPQVLPTPVPLSAVRPSGVHDINQRTGNAAIDHVLNLIFAGEWDQLTSEASFRPVGCSFLSTPGQFECAAGEPEGSLHEVFGVGSCSPGHLESRETLRDILASYMTSAFVYAAFEVNIGLTPDPQYVVIFRQGVGSGYRQVRIDAQGRLTATYSCGAGEELPGPNGNTILPRPS